MNRTQSPIRRFSVHHVCAAFFFCVMAYVFLFWPIGGSFSDSDLWYHLSGGRYCIKHLKIPTDAYFSFLSPGKSWSNYYWLFQVIVFSIFKLAGYYGLILFRALLYLSTVFLMHRLLSQGDIPNTRVKQWAVVLLAVYGLAILPRELFLVRPHLFSYLFIVAVLYILETKGKLFWLIPFMYLAWGNLHGMEYPIALLIVLSYLSEQLIDKFRKCWAGDEMTTRQRLLLISSIYCLFLTPAGLSLITLPLEVSPFLNQAIGEMLPSTFRSYLKFDFRTLSGTLTSLQNVLVMLNILLCIYLVSKKKLRVSHLLLVSGALILLLLNTRFVVEAILLTLPLAKTGLAAMPGPAAAHRKPVLVWLALVTTAAVLPLLLLLHLTTIRPNYPISYQKFPFGNTAFLQQLGAGGRVLNEHNTGGFVHWQLYPNHPIFMDLQMSIFDVSDLYYSIWSRKDPNMLQRFIDEHHPSFILVSHQNNAFKNVFSALPENSLVPVFIDDSEILFAVREQVPEIADTYALRYVDPFQVLDMPYDSMTDHGLSDLLSELMRMQTVYPNTALINTMITNVLLKLERFDNTLAYPQNIIAHHPDNHIGYALKGQVLFAQSRFDEAIPWLAKAYRMPGGKQNKALLKNLHSAYFKIKAYKKAYHILVNGINVFREEIDHNDLYTLAIYAAAAGKKFPSQTLLRLADIKTPMDDLDGRRKLQEANFWE